MRNYLFILTVMKIEIRHTAKTLPLAAISEWPRSMAPYRCLRGVFKQHRHHCLPAKIHFQTSFLILVPPLWSRCLIWAMECSETRPFYELKPATDENSIFQHLEQRCMEPFPTASPRTGWIYCCINSRYRRREIDIIIFHVPSGMIMNKSCNEDSLKIIRIIQH